MPIITTGAPQRGYPLWGEEPPQSERARANGAGEGYGADGDEGAPGIVTDKQLDELNIKCTKVEED